MQKSNFFKKLKTEKFIIILTFLVLLIYIGDFGLLYVNRQNVNKGNTESTIAYQATIQPTCIDDTTHIEYSMPNDGNDGILARL